MRCPIISDLPPPPAGKIGWPWTFEARQLPDINPDGRPWPRISIVTPTLDQGQFIEETIRSVLLQGYPHLEYIIIDGASDDETRTIIKKYEPWLTHWVSEKDRGQSDAINKGLTRSTGDIFQFINSDDLLAEGALGAIAGAYRRGMSVAGSVLEFNGKSKHLVANKNLVVARMLRSFKRSEYCQYHQPGVWLERENLVLLGGFDKTFQYCFDYDVAIRYLQRWPKVSYLNSILVHSVYTPRPKQ